MNHKKKTEERNQENLKCKPCSSIISQLFFWWIIPLLRKGCRSKLTLSDLHEPSSVDSSARLGDIFDKEWNIELNSTKDGRAKLWRIIRNIIWQRYAVIGACFCFDELLLRVVQTLTLKAFIQTFETSEPDRTYQLVLATALTLMSGARVMFYQSLLAATVHIGLHCRLGISSLIFRKILQLRKSNHDLLNMGKLINLLSCDVGRMDKAFNLLHILYIAPIQLGLYTYLLWQELGISSLGGILVIFAIFPVQIFVGRFYTYYRTRIVKRTEDRGRFLNEIIQGIRTIKMYTWEKPFSRVMSNLRKAEMDYIRRFLYLDGLFLTLDLLAAKLIPFSALVIYVVGGNQLTTDKAAFCISVFNLLAQTVLLRTPFAASSLTENLSVLGRVEDFLLFNESHTNNNLTTPRNKVRVNANGGARVTFVEYSASWSEDAPVLENINVDLRGNKLVIVIGHVGTGKTSFLNGILSELPTVRDNSQLSVQGRLSYASQDAWIFPSSIRENILLGLEMDKGKYKRIIQLTCLAEDLDNLPDGDLTTVGERGLSLSGGQRARVNLARALYQDADIYLFDDPLSAVDARVGKHIFHSCIKENLNGKLRILVTHQLQYLPIADHIIVLNRQGRISSQGRYKDLQNSDVEFSTLLAEQHSKSSRETVPKNLPGENSGNVAKIKKNENFGRTKAEPVLRGTTSSFRVLFSYFKLGWSNTSIFLITVVFLIAQFLGNTLDYQVAQWKHMASADGDCEKDAETSSILASFLSTVNSTKSEDLCPADLPRRSLQVYNFIGIICAYILLSVLRSILFFRSCLRISTELHQKMFTSIIHAPVQFFTENPSGRIMHRFTKDLNQIEERLPVTFFDSATLFLIFLGMLGVNVVANVWTVGPALGLLYCMGKVRQFYLTSAMDLKSMEAVAKAPLFTHTTSTVQGLTTIRALNAEGRTLNRFDEIQDTHTSVYYAMTGAARWFGLWIELATCTFFLGVVSFGYILLGISNGADVAMAITTILSLTGALQCCMMQSAEAETHCTAVERALEYCDLKPEDKFNMTMKTQETRQRKGITQGQIEFKEVSLFYQGGTKALDRVTFSINPGEKVGIVGRTGAGKSSLVAALLRLATISEGVITIDEEDIESLSLEQLRLKISVIPQDPILFTGTLRFNLDPLQEFSDKKISKILEQLGLHSLMENLEESVADGGCNFSTGERQLLCLARVLLRKDTRILVLDEATANVDPITAEIVQRTVQSRFSHCTILTVAHGLQSILESDKIMVMDKGQIVEFSSPSKLKNDRSSVFYAMTRSCGKL